MDEKDIKTIEKMGELLYGEYDVERLKVEIDEQLTKKAPSYGFID